MRTTVDAMSPSMLRNSDIMLPFVVYLGQRRSLPEGLILSLFASHLFSLCSAAPIGVFTSHYLILFLVARLITYVTYANAWYSILAMMFSLSLLGRILLALIAAFFGHGWGFFSEGFWIIPHLILNAFVGYVIYTVMDLLDRMTFKATRNNIEMSEGGL